METFFEQQFAYQDSHVNSEILTQKIAKIAMADDCTQIGLIVILTLIGSFLPVIETSCVNKSNDSALKKSIFDIIRLTAANWLRCHCSKQLKYIEVCVTAKIKEYIDIGYRFSGKISLVWAD